MSRWRRQALGSILTTSAALLFMGGCSAGQPDTFAVRFQDDLSQPMYVALCHSDHSATCEHPYYRDRVSARGSIEENISPDVRTEWAIEDRTGRPRRCVVLYWKNYPGSDQTVLISQAPRWHWPSSRGTAASPLR